MYVHQPTVHRCTATNRPPMYSHQPSTDVHLPTVRRCTPTTRPPVYTYQPSTGVQLPPVRRCTATNRLPVYSYQKLKLSLSTEKQMVQYVPLIKLRDLLCKLSKACRIKVLWGMGAALGHLSVLYYMSQCTFVCFTPSVSSHRVEKNDVGFSSGVPI